MIQINNTGGIPVEVYHFFFFLPRGPLLHVLNRRLSDTQQECLISLLLKQDSGGIYIYNDPLHFKNWRPLTL